MQPSVLLKKAGVLVLLMVLSSPATSQEQGVESDGGTAGQSQAERVDRQVEYVESSAERVESAPVEYVESSAERVERAPVEYVESSAERVESAPVEYVESSAEHVERAPVEYVEFSPERVDVKNMPSDELVRITNEDRVKDSGDEWRLTGDRFSAEDTDRLMKELGAEVEDGEVRLQFASTVLFEFDSVSIRPDASEELQKVAHLIRAHASDRVIVVGHTDSKGSDEYNRDLSQNRAVAVMRWLNGQESIPAEILYGHGAGESYPVAPNTHENGEDNPDGRAENRRVEIIITG
jgi:outer membrane protein OmpA-like peptidoglycan-associated protein